MQDFKSWREGNFDTQVNRAANTVNYSGINAQEPIHDILGAFETLDIDVPAGTDPVHFAAMLKRVANDMAKGGDNWRQLLSPPRIKE